MEAVVQHRLPLGVPGVYFITLLIVLFGGCIGLAYIAGATALAAVPPIVAAVAYLLKVLLGTSDAKPPELDVETPPKPPRALESAPVPAELPPAIPPVNAATQA
jgi:hypothetical protein